MKIKLPINKKINAKVKNSIYELELLSTYHFLSERILSIKIKDNMYISHYSSIFFNLINNYQYKFL